MVNLEKFGSIRKNYSGIADFVTVYIAEAHPAERGDFIVGRDVGGNYDINTHNNVADRLSAAQTLKDEAGPHLSKCPILVDPMDDRANIAFAALPERLYVILDGNVVYEGGIGPFDYNLEEMEAFLGKTK